jgi:hypothetical protein
MIRGSDLVSTRSICRREEQFNAFDNGALLRQSSKHGVQFPIAALPLLPTIPVFPIVLPVPLILHFLLFLHCMIVQPLLLTLRLKGRAKRLQRHSVCSNHLRIVDPKLVVFIVRDKLFSERHEGRRHTSQ